MELTGHVGSMIMSPEERLAQAQRVIDDLKRNGYKDKELHELSLLVLLELGCNVESPRVDGHSI